MWIEQAFLSKVLETGDLDKAIQLGAGPALFLDNVNREIYATIHEHFSATGSVPSIAYVKQRHPKFNAVQVHQLDIKGICHELKERRLKARVQTICSQTMQQIEKATKEAFYALREQILSLQELYASSHDVTLKNGYDAIREKYEALERNKGVIGIPWPWPTLTQQSHGIQPGQFVLFYGRQKSMKTWTMLWAAVEMYRKHNKRVLVCTWEMSPEDLMWRVAAIMAEVDYELWNSGQLPKAEKERAFRNLAFLRTWEHELDNTETRPTIIVTTIRGTDGRPGGVSLLKQKIEERRPDVLFVDGLYNMGDDRERKRSFNWRNQAEVVVDLHQLGVDMKLPVVASTQANRAGSDPDVEGTEDVGFTDTAAMYCAYMLKNYVRQADGGADIYMRFKATRDFRHEGIKIHARPANVFEEVASYKTAQEFNDAVGIAKGNGKTKNGNGGNKGVSDAEIVARMSKAGKWT